MQLESRRPERPGEAGVLAAVHRTKKISSAQLIECTTTRKAVTRGG